MTTEQPSYRLTDSELAATRQRVAKMNERAARKGIAGHIDLDAVRETWSERTPISEVQRVGWRVTLVGTPPKHDGWSFLARVDAVGDDFVVNTVPGTDEGAVDRSLLRKGWCDHCQTRRNRSKVLLVKHDDSRQMQVGTSCIKDFLGTDQVIVWNFDKAGDMLGGYDGASGRDWWFPTRDVIAATLAVMDADRGSFRPSSFENSTVSQVRDVLDPPRAMSKERVDVLQLLADEAALIVERFGERIDAVLDFVATTDADNDYLMNLRAALSTEAVEPRHLGLAVSAPAALDRHLGKVAERENREKSQHLGTVGETMTTTLEVGKHRWFSTAYGRKCIATFHHGDDVVVWKTTSDAFAERVGDTITATFTVAEHSTYRDTKQTVVKRLREAKEDQK